MFDMYGMVDATIRSRHYHRSTWQAGAWHLSVAQNAPVKVPSVPVEPSERIIEADLPSELSWWLQDDECVYCGGHDERVNLIKISDAPDEIGMAHVACLKA